MAPTLWFVYLRPDAAVYTFVGMTDRDQSAQPNVLPFATHLDAPIEGQIKHVPEDFRVDEVPLYAATGTGEHLYVRFQKRDLDTKIAVRRIADALGASERDAGFAGMKDRRAVTTQWASFVRGDAERLKDAKLEGIEVLEVSRHANKLRTGHLAGNRFTLRLRGADPARAADAERVLGELATRGVPAYYGEQRFGRDGDNVARARAWIVDGGPPPRAHFERKLFVSSLQSAIFNELLAARVSDGTWCGVIDGDVVRKEDSGGLFIATGEALPDAQARAERFEVSATGPMMGAKMKRPEGAALAQEEAAMARHGLDEAKLARFARDGEGTRRPYRMKLTDPTVTADPEGLVLSFTLPAGAYATVVLRELTRADR